MHDSATIRRLRISSRWGDYVALAKPRVILLLLLTGLTGLFVAANGRPAPGTVLWLAIGGLLSVAGANAVNCYLDRDIDARMERTCHRPVAAGRLDPASALAFGVATEVVAIAVLWMGTNPLTAVLALAGFAHYVLVYTVWLKRRSRHNIVIGGAAGALPPLVGWAAASGQLTAMPLLLAAIIFSWTPVHFYTLALLRRDEYAAVGVPMLPVVAGVAAGRRAVARYAAVTLALGLLPPFVGAAGGIYALGVLPASALLAAAVRRMKVRADAVSTRRAYLAALLYLMLLFLALWADAIAPA